MFWFRAGKEPPPLVAFAQAKRPVIFEQAAEIPTEQRNDRLHRAAQAGHFVVLDIDRDQHLLETIPRERRYLRMTRTADTPAHWRDILAQLWTKPAYGYLLEATNTNLGGVRALLDAFAQSARNDTCVWAAGPQFTFTHALAACLGAPLIQADPAEVMGPANLFTLSQWQELGFPQAASSRHIRGILGPHPYGSKFPKLHNMGYRALSMDALFLPISCPNFSEFHQHFLQAPQIGPLTLEGFTVLAPGKEACLALADRQTPAARGAGAANLFYRENGQWIADSSDGNALLNLLARHTIPKPAWAAVVGVGATGRAVALALQESGVKVVLVNRDPVKGIETAARLGTVFQSLATFRVKPFDLVVHVTPVGKNGEPAPFSLNDRADHLTLVEFVYGRQPTKLVEAAAAKACRVYDGHAVLAENARYHFKAMVGAPLPDPPLN